MQYPAIEPKRLSGTEPILGDSGVGAGTYSAVSVNAKGIAVAGKQVVLYYAKSSPTNPATDSNLVNGGFALVEIQFLINYLTKRAEMLSFIFDK